MQSTNQPVLVSQKMLWTGRIMSALPVLMLTFSGVMKLLNPPGLADGFNHLGVPVNLALGLGILELSCTIIYVIPRTAVLGAILLTGYLGGAVLTHLRVGDPFLAPVLPGVLLWGGLYLRDPWLRTLIPLRRNQMS